MESQALGSFLYASVPRYVVSLNDPPAERWNQVVDAYKEHFLEMERWVSTGARDNLGALLGPMVETIASTLFAGLNKLGVVYFHEELAGIAARAGLKLGTLVLLQLIYEASTCCTSIVVPDGQGVPHHARTMDWELPQLSPMTIEVEFIKDGRTLCVATTWAGYVGILTGLRPGKFSCSVNFRASLNGSIWTNLKQALKAAWPIGFLLRQTLEDSETYIGAKALLSESELIAPVYFTLAGTLPGEGAIITRSTSQSEVALDLATNARLVQTNADHCVTRDVPGIVDILESFERRDLAYRLLDSTKPEHVCADVLWQVLSHRPILNEETIYGTYMHPKTGALETRLPQVWNGFVLGSVQPSARIPHAIYVASPSESRVVIAANLKCVVCNASFLAHRNSPGHCSHSEPWHSDFASCSKVRCAFGLGVGKIGRQHWGCCFDTDRTALVCPHSSPHRHEIKGKLPEYFK